MDGRVKSFFADYIATLIALSSAAATKPVVKKLVDFGMFLTSESTLHDVHPKLWPSPHLTTEFREDKERLSKLGVCVPDAELAKAGVIATWQGS